MHADFYLQYTDHTYIRVYGSEDQPLLLPRYASDKLVLMEFSRQLLFLKERVWRKKDATINLLISIASYVFQTWVAAKNMKEIQQYIFYKEAIVRNYDPKGVIVRFYNIAFQKKSLGNVEKYRNVRDEGEITKIDALLSKNKAPLQAKKTTQRPRTVKERPKEVPLRIKTPPPASVAPPQVKESLLPIGKRQGTLGQYASMGSSKRSVVTNTTKISQEVADLRDSSYHDVPLSVLE